MITTIGKIYVPITVCPSSAISTQASVSKATRQIAAKATSLSDFLMFDISPLQMCGNCMQAEALRKRRRHPAPSTCLVTVLMPL